MVRSRVRLRVAIRGASRDLEAARQHRDDAWQAYYVSTKGSASLFCDWLKWERLVRDYEDLIDRVRGD